MQDTEGRKFPVLDMEGRTIPWEVAEIAHRNYRHDQTLERVAERGGFSYAEIMALLMDDYRNAGSHCPDCANHRHQIRLLEQRLNGR